VAGWIVAGDFLLADFFAEVDRVLREVKKR
jgi:hypothetical protein